jgi:hypothetical protein
MKTTARPGERIPAPLPHVRRGKAKPQQQRLGPLPHGHGPLSSLYSVLLSKVCPNQISLRKLDPCPCDGPSLPSSSKPERSNSPLKSCLRYLRNRASHGLIERSSPVIGLIFETQRCTVSEILFELVRVSLAQQVGMGVLFPFENSFIFLKFCFGLARGELAIATRARIWGP